MKNTSVFGWMMMFAVLGVGSLPVQSQNPPTPSNTTRQPQVPTWRQFVDRGGRRYIQVDYDLPTEFRDGFVYFNQGASVINAFILKKGLSSYTSIANDIEIDFQVAERYVKSGQAIQFSWNLGNSSLRYANDTEVRFPSRGTGCFRANCLTAPFLNNAQISRILLSKRRITQSSQTATGRSTNIRQRDTTNSSAQSSREVQFRVCSESQTWVRPNEAEQETKLNSLSRYANREYRQNKFWTDNIFLFTSYGLAARHEPVYISGLWTIDDEALKCYKPEGITQKINSGQIAEIWLLQHRVKKIEWQNDRYVMVVAPVQKGAQFINFSRVERQYPLNLKVVSENGTELANLTAPGSPVVTARLPIRGQQTTTGRSQNSNQCPTGQLPVTIKTPDGQSPSYAGATRAGRNRNGKRDNGSKIEAETRCILFVEIQKPSNPKQTWVITHGWDDSSTGSLNSLAREVAKQNPGDRVLMLDWSEASMNSGDNGANPLRISEKLSRGNYYAATWIRPVAEVAVNELKNKYGISDAEANKNLNLIGHSLGSIMSSEIGYIYSKSQRNVEGNKKGINLMIALDPPSEFNVGLSNSIVGLGGYDVDGRTPAYKDVRKPSVRVPILNVPILNIEVLPPLTLTSPFETRTLVPNNVDRPQRFDKVSRFSRAFVGKTSFAGNQVLAATANESFQMDFGDRSDTPLSLGTEHMLVVEAFTKRISGAGLIPGFLGLKDRQMHTDIKQNAYPYLINPLNPTKAKYEYGHEGVINISSSNEFKAFHLESRKLGKVVFSNTDSATEDTTYRSIDLSVRGDESRVAGGSLYPNVFEIFPSISPINYTPLIR